ncbi:MAG: T9SS type A sorting domain-containing protein [Bacteroidales bacterium]|nr:T9SS type A sorting domain-containing protein [Bacteroidales bacterium]
MKKITLVIISLFTLQALFSQTVLTSDLNFKIGDTYRYDGYLDVPNIDPGPGGANFTWDFGNISAGTYYEGNSAICVDPSTTAFADSAAVTNANICIRNLDNPNFGPYQYYDCNNTSQNLLAMGFLGTNNNSFTPYSDNATALEFPFTYGDSFDDTWELLMYYIDKGYYFWRDSSIVTVEADAYGTITTPAGEFQNVLRVKRTRIDYSWYDYTGEGWVPDEPFTEIQHEWYAPNIKVPVMIILEIDWLPGYNVRYLVDHNYSTGIEDRANYHLEIFPNPATERVTIKTDKLFNSVCIYSITGQQLDVAISQTGQLHQQTIDLNMYPKGVYLIEVGFEDGNVVKEKIIKQ